MAASEIYLLRHGETEWNVDGRFQGGLDSPLTEKGRSQAALCGQLLAPRAARIHAFYASPLGRVRQTVPIVRSFGDYPDTLWDARLREVSLGSWDGLTDADIDGQWPGLLDGASPFDWYFRSPDGEGYDRAMDRIGAWLNDLEGVVVAVSHGLIGRLVRGAYLGLARERALTLPVPQDVIWHLAGGEVKAVA